MKKLRLLSLLLVLVMLASAFAACEGEDEPKPEDPVTFADFLNPEYNILEPTVSKLEAVTDLEGYNIAEIRVEEYDSWDDDWYETYYDAYNSYFAIFEKADETNPDNVVTTYKVFSFITKNIIATFKADNDVTFAFDDNSFGNNNYDDYDDDELPMLFVTKSTAQTENDLPVEPKVEYFAYDLSGKEIIKRSSGIEMSKVDDLIIFENDVYTYDEKNGTLTKKGNLPINVDISLRGEASYKNDDYLYFYGDRSVFVVDNDFNIVAVWSQPSNTSMMSFEILNSGDVLLQYSKELVPDATDYDYYTPMTSGYISTSDIKKYDLITEIFSVTEKTSKTIDVNFIIEQAIAYDKAEENNEYVEFENVLTTYPIIEKRISTSDADVDFVYFGNDGVVGKSLKLTENQIALPRKIATDTYMVRTLYGYAIIDLEGKVISPIINEELEIVGDYIVTEYGIYDLSFNLVYDFSENNVNDGYYVMDNTIFVRENASADSDETDYSILTFSKGEKKVIYTYKEADEKHSYFTIIDNYYDEDSIDIYAIYTQSEEKTEYKYYNADGKLLLTADVELLGNYNINGSILYQEVEGVYRYYLITK